MRKRILPTTVLALGLIAAPAAAHAAPPAGDELDTELLEAKLEDFYKTGDHSVIVEARAGDETWSEAIGPRGLDEDADDAKADDRVRIASLTKSMVATILLQLQSEGAVDLDDALSDHLPGLLPYEQEPTIRQVLNHTSGLFDYFYYLYTSMVLEGDLSDFYANYRTHYSPEELVEIGTQDPPLFEPGADWAYSNTGYMALGLLVEELTGNSLGHELNERVFEPVGLDDTYLPHDDSFGFRGPHLKPYLTTGESERPYFDTRKLSHTQMWAAGGVISTMGDVNDFYDAFTDGTLLTGEQLAEASEYVDTDLGFGYGLGLYGLALGCPDDPEAVYLGHTGGGLGHQTYSFHSFDGERQITFSWNIDDRHGYADPEAFDRALAGLLVAGLCGVDNEGEASLRTLEVPDFASLDELMFLG